MKKVEITDEMVARAIEAGPKRYRIYARGDDPGVKQAFRNALDAALNQPPPEPEILVTEEMCMAGNTALHAKCRPGLGVLDIAGCYRAMRKLEKPQTDRVIISATAHHPEPGINVTSRHLHSRKNDMGLGTEWEHRRKTD